MEIERLTAKVDADTATFNRQVDHSDEKLDELAEDRTAIITVRTVGDDDRVRDRGALNLPGANDDGGFFRGLNKIVDGLFDSFKKFGNMLPGMSGHFEVMDKGITDFAKHGATGVDSITSKLSLLDKVGIGVASGMATMATSAAGAAMQIGMVVGAVVLLGPAIVALGGAVVGLVAALAPLVGLLAVLPGLFLVVGGAAAVLIPAFMGVGEAIGEVLTAEKDAEKNALALSQAQFALAGAELTLARAARVFASARRDAAEAIEDAQFASRQAQLSEERAILGLSRAYKRLTDIQSGVIGKTEEITKVTDDFTGKQFEVARITMDAVDSKEDEQDAILGVKEAELALEEARDNREDTQIRLNELEEKGIENSDILVDATRNLEGATLGLESAQRGYNDAMEATTGHGSAYKELTPEAQAFVDLIASLKPLWDGFQDTMQATIFPSLTTAMENMRPLFEAGTTIFEPMAAAMGTVIEDFTKLFGQESFIEDLRLFFSENAENIATLGGAFANIGQGLMDLTIAAQPLFDLLTTMFVDSTESFAEWAKEGRESGELAKWFELTGKVLQQVFDIVGNLIGAFAGLAEAGTPFGDWLLQGIVDSTAAMDEFTNSASGQEGIAAFFERIKEPLTAIKDLAKDLLFAFVDVFGSQESMDFLTNFANTMRVDVLPVIKDIFKAIMESGFLDKFLNMITKGAKMTQTLIDEGMLDGFLIMMGAVMDIIGFVFDLIGELGELNRAGADWVVGIVLGLDTIDDKFKEFFTDLPDRIKDWFLEGVDDAITAMTKPFEDMINKIIGWYNAGPGKIPKVPDIDYIGSRAGENSGEEEDDEAGSGLGMLGGSFGGSADTRHSNPANAGETPGGLGMSGITFNQTFNTPIDPVVVGREVSWSLVDTLVARPLQGAY